jgi:hypothetical protein
MTDDTQSNLSIRDQEISDSKLIFDIVALLISSDVLDEVAQTQGIFTSKQSKWLIDASHLSSALHCFLSAKRQKIKLKPVERPPMTMDAVGGFFLKILQGASPQSLIETHFTTKKNLGSTIVALLKLSLNELVLLRNKVFKSAKVYGRLYNIEPSFSLSKSPRIFWCSLRYGLIRIESLSRKLRVPNLKIEHSDTIRDALRIRLERILEVKCTDVDVRTTMARFLAQVVPITHLEGRKIFFQSGLRIARELGATKIYSANGFADSSYVALIAAASKEITGAKIIGIQHGGFYGYCYVHSHAFNTEYQFLDKFVTWGWNNPNSPLGHIRPELLSEGSFHLFKVSNSAKKRSPRLRNHTKILFVECAFYTKYFRFEHNYDFNKLNQLWFSV